MQRSSSASHHIWCIIALVLIACVFSMVTLQAINQHQQHLPPPPNWPGNGKAPTENSERDLVLLSEMHHIYGILDGIKPTATSSALYWQNSYIAFAQRTLAYQDIIYIDINGKEQVHVSCRDVLCNAVTPSNDDWSKQPIFEQALHTPSKKVFIPPVRPHEDPAQHATVIYDNNKQPTGIIIANINPALVPPKEESLQDRLEIKNAQNRLTTALIINALLIATAIIVLKLKNHPKQN